MPDTPPRPAADLPRVRVWLDGSGHGDVDGRDLDARVRAVVDARLRELATALRHNVQSGPMPDQIDYLCAVINLGFAQERAEPPRATSRHDPEGWVSDERWQSAAEPAPEGAQLAAFPPSDLGNAIRALGRLGALEDSKVCREADRLAHLADQQARDLAAAKDAFNTWQRAALTYRAERDAARAACVDCGRPYGDQHGFPDLLVSNETWKAISPTGHDGGLLCPSCICARAYKARVTDPTARFVSGPFCAPEQGAPDLRPGLAVALEIARACERGWSERTSIAGGKARHEAAAIIAGRLDAELARLGTPAQEGEDRG